MGRFCLLGDRPSTAESDDPLGFAKAAESLANLILESNEATPFTLGIQAGWGMGKTSLMRRIASELEARGGDGVVTTVEFNPWTTSNGNTLEGLMKAVLNEVQGPLEKLLNDEKVKKRLRVATRVAFALVNRRDVADAVWSEVDNDPAARSELRELMDRAMHKAREDVPGRLVCVFVDDLDRCSPRSVFDVFEAIKLYLDVEGLAFVIGYDDDVISETILASEQYSAKLTARDYLEKIVQVVYPIHRPEDDQTTRLMSELIERSGTAEIVGRDKNKDYVGTWSHRNPRRMKRLINTLIIQHQALGEADAKPGLAEAAFELFYRDFVRERDNPTRDLEAARDFGVLEKLQDDTDPELRERYSDWLNQLRRRMHQPEQATPAELLNQMQLHPDLVRCARDWRFLEIAERLPHGDELREVMHRISERLPPAQARELVPSAAAAQMVKALKDSSFAWRTAKGIADDAGLTVDDVLAVIGRNPQTFRESDRPNKRGARLFQLRKPALA